MAALRAGPAALHRHRLRPADRHQPDARSPEFDARGRSRLSPSRIGAISIVQAVDPADPGKLVASLGGFGYADYCREAYEAGSGILTIPIDAGAAKTAAGANIQIVQVSTSTALLAEAPLRAIPLDPQPLSRRRPRRRRPGSSSTSAAFRPGPACPVTLCTMDAPRREHPRHPVIYSGAGGIAEFPVSSDDGRDLDLRAGAGAEPGFADRRASTPRSTATCTCASCRPTPTSPSCRRPATMSMRACSRTGTRWRRAWTIGWTLPTRPRSWPTAR